MRSPSQPRQQSVLLSWRRGPHDALSHATSTRGGFHNPPERARFIYGTARLRDPCPVFWTPLSNLPVRRTPLPPLPLYAAELTASSRHGPRSTWRRRAGRSSARRRITVASVAISKPSSTAREASPIAPRSGPRRRRSRRAGLRRAGRHGPAPDSEPRRVARSTPSGASRRRWLAPGSCAAPWTGPEQPCTGQPNTVST